MPTEGRGITNRFRDVVSRGRASLRRGDRQPQITVYKLESANAPQVARIINDLFRGGTGGGGGVKIVKGERRLNKVRISMYIKWEDWNDIYNEVIDPLAKEGADLMCQVIVIAQGDAAIRENTVELGITGRAGK